MGVIKFFGSGQRQKFKWGNALWMDNVDDSVIIPYSPSLDFSGKSFTICVWSYSPELATSWNNLLVNWTGITSEQYWSFMLGSTTLGANSRINTGNSVQFQRTNSGASIGDYLLNAWDFRAYKLDLSAGVFGITDSRINRNTSSVESFPLYNNSNVTDVVTNYSFASKIWTLNAQMPNFGGARQKKYVDVVAFFDRALSDSETYRIFGKGKGYLPTKIPGCVACYLFDETPGTAIISSSETPGSPASRIILDQSGNGNHAYAVGYSPGSTDFVNHETLL